MPPTILVPAWAMPPTAASSHAPSFLHSGRGRAGHDRRPLPVRRGRASEVPQGAQRRPQEGGAWWLPGVLEPVCWSRCAGARVVLYRRRNIGSCTDTRPRRCTLSSRPHARHRCRSARLRCWRSRPPAARRSPSSSIVALEGTSSTEWAASRLGAAGRQHAVVAGGSSSRSSGADDAPQ